METEIVSEPQNYATSVTPEEREKAIVLRKEKQTALDRIKAYASMEEVRERFVALLGDREGRRYVESVVIAVANSDTLQECTPKSIMVSAMRCASLGLSVDPIVKQAHLVPMRNGDKKEATLIVDYHGLVQLSEETGYYAIPPNVFEVYEGEKAVLERFSGKVTIEGERVGDKVIGWCGYFQAKNGVERWLYMTNEECDAHGLKYNPGGYNSKRSAWNTDRDKMRRKTVLRQLVSRWGKFSPHVEAQLHQEDEVIDAETVTLPSDENIVVPEHKTRPEAEILAELGFAPRPEAEKPREDPSAEPEQVAPIEEPKLIDPMSNEWVAWAALQWNISKSDAAKAIAKKKLGKSVEEAEFKQIVNGGK